MNDKLKTEHVKLDVREALQASPAVLLGVTQAGAAALKQVEIESVFDLATSRLFANASQLLRAGLDPKDTYYRYGSPPKDVVNDDANGHRVDELRFQGVEILEGLDAAKAKALSEALDVKTVRDLALWPPYLAARHILNDAYFPELEAGFDPEAPADLLPKSGEYPTERVFYHTLVLDQVGTQPDKEIEQAGPIDIAPTLDQSFGFKNLGVGALLTVSQSWYAQGVALGQLLHSTALAPGESTRIAMMDWSRRTKAGTTETISESEQLDNETMHSRSLSEVTKAVANEAQAGFSSTNNTSTASQKGKSTGSATVNADPINALTGGLFGDDPGVTTGGTTESESTVSTTGMTVTSSSGNRSLEASTTQKVMDRTQQHANSVRNRRASIVREVSQEEHQGVSTRAVTNYNHMHALSIQYYEVVQIYRVEVGISDVEKCIFVPMKLVDFTQPVVDEYRLVLARSALDRGAYELLTTRYGVVEIIPQTPRITPSGLLAKAAKVQVARAVLRDDLFSLAMADMQPTAEAQAATKATEQPVAKQSLNIRPSVVDVLAAKGYDLAQIDYAAKVTGKGVVQPNSDSLFLPDDAVITGLLVRDGLVATIEAKVRGESTRIGIGPDGISLTQSLSVTDIESVQLTSGKDEEQTIGLVLQCNYLGVAFPLSVKVRLAGGAGMQEVIRFGNVRASNDLIEHLNANKLHYSQAIYRSLDASSLALLLSPYSYEGKPVVQLIDPTPVTVSANYLVFKMHEEEFEPTEEGEDGERLLSEWGKWLKDHGISKSRVKTDLIPLPSGGVFAEAVLGRYNAAEKLDMTRFWNWQDSPIPIAAPEIAPVEVTSRGTPEDLKPGQLGAPVVSIVNPTALPDPTGLPAVLQAIQNGNMFRDMSGLAATMALAQTGMSAASQGATAAGAQAGTNAAVAAQLLSDLAKTAASVLTMGVGGAIGGAAGGLLGAGGGSGGGGNISNAGALMNQGRSMTQRSAGGSVSGGGGGSGVRMGGSDGGAPTGGGFADNGTDSGSGGGAPFGGSADFEAQAFNRALWGQAGESGADSARLMLASAIPDLGVVGDLKNPISVLLGGDDYLKPLPVDEVHAWYQRLAQSIRKQDADSLAADLLEKWLDGGGGLFVYQPRNPDQNRIFTSPFVLDYLRQRVRPVFLTEGKGRNAGKEKWLGLIPRIQKLPGFPAWDGTSPITMTYKGESVEIPLQVQVDALRGKGRREDLDLLYALHDFAIQTEVVVKLIRRGTTMVHDVNFEKWESKALDRYDWDPTKHITVPNPDYKNVFGVAKPVAPGEEMITVYHTNAKRLEAAGLAKPFNFESGVWTPTNDPTIDGPAVIDASKVLN